jgi:hypothetical protein
MSGEKPSRCTRCGYDLRAHAEGPQGLKCPECGNVWIRGVWGDPVCRCGRPLAPRLFRPELLECSSCVGVTRAGEIGISMQECRAYLWRSLTICFSMLPITLTVAFLMVPLPPRQADAMMLPAVAWAVGAPTLTALIVRYVARGSRLRQRLALPLAGAITLNLATIGLGYVLNLMAHFAG